MKAEKGATTMDQKEKPQRDEPEYQRITVKTSDGETIQGKVYLKPNTRVSDLFTKSDSPFIVLVDALLRAGQDKTLIVNKDHIVWVEPED
jgi:hypothetical protein